jgi:nitrite reductase/ring-hydroxylating ferredoxin subunit
MSEFRKAAKKSEIAPNEGRCVEMEGKRIALFNLGGEFCAIDDTCTHRGGPLSEGTVEGDQVTCPWHGAVFNIKTGAVSSPPAPAGVAKYNVRVTGDDIEIEV